MERDSFIFYRSFYEAIKDLPRDIRLEVYTAIMEYALYGRLPEDLKPFAKGIFTLIKPNIDVNNVRFENGRKGGRKPSAKGKPEPVKPAYLLTFEQEVERMKADDEWKKTLCADTGIKPDEYDARLSRFLRHCNEEKKRKGKARHDSYEDACSHLRYWMSKAYPSRDTVPDPSGHSPLPFPDLAGDDFGGMDYDEQR